MTDSELLDDRDCTLPGRHCFGDCGKISMAGAIADDQTGGLFVCCEAQCPYEAEVFPNYGETMSFGRPHVVHIRILREERK
jgi:hypothetical protein